MADLETLLSGGDLRTLGKSSSLTTRIKSQQDFDLLFQFLFHRDRRVVMRAADTIEKLTKNDPRYLQKHKKKIIALCKPAIHKELQWHIAQLIPRLSLDPNELGSAWHLLSCWARNKNNSRIVRVNSLQALFDLKDKHEHLKKDFALTVQELKKENIPSLKARIRKLIKPGPRFCK